jgi:general secretion pathway protein J
VRAPRVGGFTLLELLVALAVFAMVSLMAYSGLRTVLLSKQVTEQHAGRIQQLQSAVRMLERDLSQLAQRSIRDDYGDRQEALRTADFGPITLEFTRAGWLNPTAMARSTLQRVAYGIEEESLQRYSWTVLDRAQESIPDKVLLLDGVREMRLRYLDDAGEWHEQWPPAGLGQAVAISPTGQTQTVALPSPRALEVTLRLEDMGEIRRLIPLLQPPPPAAPPPATAPPPSGGSAAEGEENP